MHDVLGAVVLTAETREQLKSDFDTWKHILEKYSLCTTREKPYYIMQGFRQ